MGRSNRCEEKVINLLRYVSILFLSIFMLLAVTQSVDNLFHSFIVLCENEYFLIPNLHGSFINVTSCPLVLLPLISFRNDLWTFCYWFVCPSGLFEAPLSNRPGAQSFYLCKQCQKV